LVVAVPLVLGFQTAEMELTRIFLGPGLPLLRLLAAVVVAGLVIRF
jgi:hypothetical protein